MSKNESQKETIIQSLYEAAPVAVIIHSNNRFLYANSLALKLFGADTFKHLSSHAVLDFVHQDDREIVSERVKIIIAGKEAPFQAVRIARLDGKEIIVEAMSSLIDYRGVQAVQDFFRDATDRIRLEKEIESVARFPSENPNPIIRLNKEGNVLYANEASKPFLRTWNCALGEKIPEYWRGVIDEAFSTGQQKNADIECEGRTYSCVIVPFPELDYANLYGRDISEHKQAEEDLRRSRNELEKRVEERTAELSTANEELALEIADRIKTAAVLNAERRRFNDVLQLLPAYLILLTPDYHVAFANRYFRERFGESHGKRCYEYLFNRTEPCEICESFKVLETNKPHHWEWKGPDGRNYSIFDYPFVDTDGSKLIMEMGIDITEEKRMGEGLRSAALYSRGLLEASLDPLVTINSDGKITDVNEATINVTGVPREQIIGTDFSNYFTEPDEARSVYQKVFAKGMVTDYPLTIRHRDGHLTDVLYNATVYKDSEGNNLGVFAAARDVTERKAVEEKQKVTNRLLELFAKKTSRKEYLDAVVQVIHEWSGCECAGIRIDDGKGNLPYESSIGFTGGFIAVENNLHLDCEDCICVRATLGKAVKSDDVLLTGSGSFRWNDGEQFNKTLSAEDKSQYRANCIHFGYQSVAIIPIRYQNEILGLVHLADMQKNKIEPQKVQFFETTVAFLIGEAVYRFNAEAELDKYRLHLQDLVDQRTAELEKTNRRLQSEILHGEEITKELERSNKDLIQFAYVASHDLQEPLRAVSGFVGLLKIDLQDILSDKRIEYMDFIVDGVKRMQALINGLLDYSRIDAQTKSFDWIESNTALKRALADLHASIKESNAKVTSDPLPAVCFDLTQLIQLFQNLISNAIKFRGEPAPEIRISVTRKPEAWEFAVSDNGIGIDPQYSDRIFLIFKRLHTREKYPGTGIGLAICKKIVERQGGKIWVKPNQGNGTTFCFTIPNKGENQ